MNKILKISIIGLLIISLGIFILPNSIAKALPASNTSTSSTNNPGCYDQSKKPQTCNTNAVDQYGNQVDTSTSSNSCYVDTNQTTADGQSEIYNLVSCNNLKTTLSNPVSSSPQCESINSSFGWILCPIFSMFSDATTFIYKSILQPLLIESPININSSDKNNTTFSIWNNFRIIGDIVLVIALLVIVYAEAVGGSIADAYTVKKMLPRILLSAIMINLSIYIVAAMVDIVNVIGSGMGSLIMSPFKDYQAIQFSGSQANWGVLGFGLFGMLGAAGGIGLGLLAWFATPLFGQVALVILLLIIIPLVLGILGIFITLIVRQGLILFLILASPVAFALYCLPNTEQYFKKWFNQLLKSLMVYPIIVLIFAVSNILSITTLKANGLHQSDLVSGASTTGFSGGVAVFVAFLMQIIPLFLVPFAFKISGGILGSVYNSVSGAFSKATKISRKMGVNQAKSSFNRAKTGDYTLSKRAINFNGKKYTGSQFRRRLTGITTGPRGNFGFGKKGDNATQLQEGLAAEAAMKNPRLQQLALTSDDGLLAMHLSGGINTDTARGRLQRLGWGEKRIKDALAAADAVGVTQANAQAATTLMAQNKSRSLGGGDIARELIEESINDLSAGSERSKEAIGQNFAFYSRKSGRTDLGGWNTGKLSSRGGWDKTSMSELAQSQDVAIGTHIEDAIDDLKNKDTTLHQAAAIRILEMQNLLPNVGAGAQKEINSGLDRLGWKRDIPLDEFLGTITNVDRNALTTKARVYGSSVPYQARGNSSQNQP